MSVYSRLGLSFDTTKFNGADQLTQNTINYLNQTSINLPNQWQLDDLSNSNVGGYYQNPHASILNNLTIVLNNFVVACNANTTTFTTANVTPNIVVLAASSALTSLSNFLTHTNNLSGVTRSSNTALYPDLNSGLAIGRQMLNITNKTDSVQNNTPILGNFTSLYIGPDLIKSNTAITNDYNTLLNTITVVGGNNTSNITDSQMNVFVSDIQTVQTLMDTRTNGDWTFYTNSLNVLSDYQTLLQFSNPGASQNSLFSLIATTKLQNDLKSQ